MTEFRSSVPAKYTRRDSNDSRPFTPSQLAPGYFSADQSVQSHVNRPSRRIFAGGYRTSEAQELSEISIETCFLAYCKHLLKDHVRFNRSLDPLVKRNIIEDIKRSFNEHNRNCSNSEVILGLINCLSGPNHFILPIQFFSSGLVSMSIVSLILGLVLGKTADLTHRHAKLTENEFLVTIKRIAGPKLEKLYFISSVLSLWLVSITFCLTGCDALYSGIQLAFPSTAFPSENTVDFSRVSYQYIGLIFVVIEFILIFPKDITKLFLITSNAAFIAFFGILFVLIVGTYDLIYHTPTFFTHLGASGINSISLFGELKFSDFLYSVGVFELSFQIHNEVINLLRVGKEQQKNSRNLSIAYRCVQTMYIVTGFFGAVIMSARYKPGDEINTLLSLFSHNDSKFIFILAIINQFLVGLQMLALAAIMLFITRSQVFTLIYGEENSPPEWIYYLFNIGILATLYLAEMFNFSPSTAMCIAGSLFGLIIMYTVPVYIHLKCMNLKAKLQNTMNYHQLLEKDMQLSISSVIPEKQTKASRVTQNVLYSILVIQGFVTLVGVIIYLAQAQK